MKLTLLLLVCALIPMCLTWVVTRKANPRAPKGYCWERDWGSQKRGTTRAVKGRCERFVCSRNGDYTNEGCGIFAPRRGCRKSPENLRLPYPRCCSREIC